MSVEELERQLNNERARVQTAETLRAQAISARERDEALIKELSDALTEIAIIVEVPRGAMMQKIRAVLEEVGFW